MCGPHMRRAARAERQIEWHQAGECGIGVPHLLLLLLSTTSQLGLRLFERLLVGLLLLLERDVLLGVVLRLRFLLRRRTGGRFATSATRHVVLQL